MKNWKTTIDKIIAYIYGVVVHVCRRQVTSVYNTKLDSMFITEKILWSNSLMISLLSSHNFHVSIVKRKPTFDRVLACSFLSLKNMFKGIFFKNTKQYLYIFVERLHINVIQYSLIIKPLYNELRITKKLQFAHPFSNSKSHDHHDC